MLNETIIIQVPSGGTVPLLSVIVTGIVTITITYITIRNNTKMIFIQANKDKINEKIIELADVAKTGNVEDIEKVIDGEDNYYIPEDLKKKIKREIKKEKPHWFSFYALLKLKDMLIRYFENEKYQLLHERILKIINKYLSP
jgi:hypothetical protein